MDSLFLEVGSNLFELIEFNVTRKGQILTFGVNVAKVREVIRLPHINPCLSSSEELLGMFSLRGEPIPAIHLAKSLGYADDVVTESHQVIVTEFLNGQAGFVVSSAKRIRRVGWDKILPPSNENLKSITGMLMTEDNKFIFILDFEQILQSMGGTKSKHASHISQSDSAISSDKCLILVDDSATARKAVNDMIRHKSVRVIEFINGENCWNAIQSGELDSEFSGACLIISDVEMPKMDGYTLCMKIKKHSKYGSVPVVLHSSLSGEVNSERAKHTGAESYVGKFNSSAICDAIDKYCVTPSRRVA